MCSIFDYLKDRTCVFFTGGGIELLVSDEAEETAHEGKRPPQNVFNGMNKSDPLTRVTIAGPADGLQTIVVSVSSPLGLRCRTASSLTSTLCANRSAPSWPGAFWGPRAPCMTSAASLRSVYDHMTSVVVSYRWCFTQNRDADFSFLWKKQSNGLDFFQNVKFLNVALWRWSAFRKYG